VEDSFLASFGKLLQPLGIPLGLDWKMITALLTGLVAKENVVATLGVLYSVGREGLTNILPTIMSPESAARFCGDDALYTLRRDNRCVEKE